MLICKQENHHTNDYETCSSSYSSQNSSYSSDEIMTDNKNSRSLEEKAKHKISYSTNSNIKFLNKKKLYIMNENEQKQHEQEFVRDMSSINLNKPVCKSNSYNSTGGSSSISTASSSSG